MQIVGGGSRNDYLNQATADATRKAVLAGPVEATVTGNVLVQAVSAGRFASLAEGSAVTSRGTSPCAGSSRALNEKTEEAARRYARSRRATSKRPPRPEGCKNK